MVFENPFSTLTTYSRSQKCRKSSFLLTTGPRKLANVRSCLHAYYRSQKARKCSCLLLVVRNVAHERLYLLLVASIKCSVDMMLKYIEKI